MISSNKTLSLLIAIGALSLSSCSKDENTSTDNCADRFVGTYAVSVIEPRLVVPGMALGMVMQTRPERWQELKPPCARKASPPS